MWLHDLIHCHTSGTYKITHTVTVRKQQDEQKLNGLITGENSDQTWRMLVKQQTTSSKRLQHPWREDLDDIKATETEWQDRGFSYAVK